MHSDSHTYAWSRRQFLGAGLLSAGALLLPTSIIRAAELRTPVRRYRALWAMGGWNHLLIEAESDDAACGAINAAVGAIRKVDRQFSVFDARSPLSLFNSCDATSVPVDAPDMLMAIDKSLSMAESLGGVFDPTVESLMWRWGFRQGLSSRASKYGLPARDWDYRMVRCDLAHARVYRNSPRITIDSGGWAKGLAAERASDAAIREGASLAQVSCGGDIYRLTPSGPIEWECAIRDPLRRRSDVAARIRHRFHTVATSGNNETYRVAPNGDRIGHLMDPRTGRPADTDLVSVSVFGDDGLAIDATSSALFVMGRSEALAWLQLNPQFGAVLFDRRWPGDPQGMTVVGNLQVTP